MGDAVKFGATLSAGGIAALVLLSGCKAEPKGQIVAIVNGEEISLQEISAEAVGRTFAPGDKKQLQRDILDMLIDRKVMVQQARKIGLDKTPEYARQSRKIGDDLVTALYTRNIAQALPPPDNKDVMLYIDQYPSEFAKREKLVIDEIQFVPPKDVKRLAGLSSTHSIDAMAADLTLAGIPFSRGVAELDTSNLDPAIVQKIRRLPVREPIVLSSGKTFIAGAVIAHEPIPTPSDQAQKVAAAAVTGKALDREQKAQIALARSKAKIRYLPGFGP